MPEHVCLRGKTPSGPYFAAYDLHSLPDAVLSRAAEFAASQRVRAPLLPLAKPKSLTDLTRREWPESFAVLARGPSLFLHDHIEKIRVARSEGRKLGVVAVDASLGPCLAGGLVPDLVVSVDPSVRILKYFGDKVGATSNDKFFLRHRDTPRTRRRPLSMQRLLELTERHGSQFGAALTPFAHPKVWTRVQEIGADAYFFTPSDTGADSTSALVTYPNLPLIRTGGNVGTTGYVLARGLGAKRVCLLAFDMGYPPETPLAETQYYDLVAENKIAAEDLYIFVRNPHLRAPWLTDLAFLGYALALTRLAEEAAQRGVETINCGRAGIVYGPGIKWGTLDAFLKQTARAA